MARSIVVPLTLFLSLGACAQIPPSGAASTPAADATSSAHCNAANAAVAVGRQPTAEVQEQARTSAGADVVRVLRHNQPITKEFRVGRLNLVLDAEGRIARVNCS